MILKRKRLSISKRITLIYSVILFSILIIFSVLLFLAIAFIGLKDTESELISNAKTVGEYVNKSTSDAESAFKELKLEYSVFYNVYDENKKLLVSNKSDLPHLKISVENKIVVFHERNKENDMIIN